MEMEIEGTSCIIIGGNHHNTLGVIRSLGFRGIKSYVILCSTSKINYVLYSRFVCNYHLLSSPNEIVQHLLTIKGSFRNKPVIISCADRVTAELDSHFEELSQYYYLPVARGFINKIMDKQLMAEIANSCNIHSPKNVCFSEMNFGDRGGTY